MLYFWSYLSVACHKLLLLLFWVTAPCPVCNGRVVEPWGPSVLSLSVSLSAGCAVGPRPLLCTGCWLGCSAEQGHEQHNTTVCWLSALSPPWHWSLHSVELLVFTMNITVSLVSPLSPLSGHWYCSRKHTHPYPLLYWCMTSPSVLECRGRAGRHGHSDLWRTGQMRCVPLWVLWKRGLGLHSIWVMLPMYMTVLVWVCFICVFIGWVTAASYEDGAKSRQLGRAAVGFSWNLLLFCSSSLSKSIICRDLAVKLRMKAQLHIEHW